MYPGHGFVREERTGAHNTQRRHKLRHPIPISDCDYLLNTNIECKREVLRLASCLVYQRDR